MRVTYVRPAAFTKATQATLIETPGLGPQALNIFEGRVGIRKEERHTVPQYNIEGLYE